ncbi:hypothetical protein BCON_0008g00600 [Botryotinia convoluta]|uniref:Uncharacterized protein n=1 Tax=Botryotinia convoluta TaxID=54673 RepID=A0A4Z1J526_9HELO|nr:hypothetical protein BCON_0008g00600 [Botryotinia convoluta]
MSTPFGKQKIRRQERYKEEQAKLNDKIYGGRNEGSSYTSSKYSSGGSSDKTRDIHDDVKRVASHRTSERSKDNTAIEADLYDQLAKSQGKTHRSGGTKR